MYSERSAARASRCAQEPKCNCRADRFIAIAVVVFGVSLAMADAAPAKRVFNIEAQPATTSLTLYARQADVQLGFATAIVDGILTNPVKGEYDRARALELLLEGTGLKAWYGESGIIIRRIPERKLTRGITEPEPATAQTNSLRLMSTAARLPSEVQLPQVPAAEADNDDEYKEAVKNREEIVVTGSRIRGAQEASPVITISREQIDQAGFATVEELVEKLPQNFGAGASLDTHRDSGSSQTVVGGSVDDRAGGTSVNLRGLGASSTLILLNGHRISPSGLTARFTNISSIPVTAIERVEVLTDGASAIYGSDAIGGVVNFILRDDYEGAETRVRYGIAEGGEKPEALFGQSVGKSWDSGNILLTYEYYHSDSLANSDRDITSTNDLSRFGGTDWRTPGGNPANVVAGGQTFAIPARQDGAALTAADFDPNVPLNLFNSRAFKDLIAGQERHSAFMHLTQKIGKAEFFAGGRYSNLISVARSSNTSIDITVSDSNPYFVDPTGTGLRTITIDNYSFGKDLGSFAESFGEIESMGAVFGVRREVSDAWELELASTWSKESGTSGDDTRLNVAAIDAAANEPDVDRSFNPFGRGSSNTNPSVLAKLIDRTHQVDSASENELWGVSLGIDGRLFMLPGGALQVATGIEYREESLFESEESFVPGTLNQIFSTDNDRDVFAGYAELLFPIVGSGNRRPWLQRLELSLAGRYENYSDFGSSTNPKVGIVWAPTQALSLGGTYGTAFRAPALYDLDVSDPNANSSIYFPQVIADLVSLRFPVIVRLGSNEDLTAEKATTWTAGFRWTPESVSGLSFGLTYFDVDFKDRIDIPGTNILPGVNDPRYAPLLLLNPTPEQIAALVNDPRWANVFGDFNADLLSGAAPVGGILDFRKTNLAQLLVTGLDLQLSYGLRTALGSLAFGLNGSYMFDFKRRLLQADPLVDEVDKLGRPIDFRARGNATWAGEKWSVSGFVNYADGYSDNISSPVRSVDSWTTVDLTVAYDTGHSDGFFGDTRCLLTAQNLFGEGPPFVDTIGGLGYDTRNANAVGRLVAFQVTKNW